MDVCGSLCGRGALAACVLVLFCGGARAVAVQLRCGCGPVAAVKLCNLPSPPPLVAVVHVPFYALTSLRGCCGLDLQRRRRAFAREPKAVTCRR